MGRSVSPAQAWRRGNPTAKHRKGRGAEKECWPAADGESRGQGGRPAADRAAGLVSGSPRDVCVFARKQSGTESGDAPAGDRLHARRCHRLVTLPRRSRSRPVTPRDGRPGRRACGRDGRARGRRTRPGAALWAASSPEGAGKRRGRDHSSHQGPYGEAGHHDPSQDPAPGAEPRTVPPDARTHAPGTSVTG